MRETLLPWHSKVGDWLNPPNARTCYRPSAPNGHRCRTDAPLDADDPDDAETFYAIKAALVQYESERIEFQQLMVDALVAAGFTTNQIAAYIDEE